MQKYFAAVFVASLFTLSPISTWASGPLSVFACEPEWKALVKVIGGDDVKVYSATTGMQDPHYIEARPSLIAKARTADMVVCTGGELEVGWLPVVQRRSGNPKIQGKSDAVFFASDYVLRLEIPDSVDRADGDVHAAGNPHVHLDPYRLLKIASHLVARIKQLDPSNAARYEERWQAFSSQWSDAILEWESQTLALKGTKVIVHHRSWSYLFDWLNWDAIAELEPVPGSPPTTRHLVSLLEVVRSEQPEAILLASYQNPRGAKWMSKRANLPVVSLPFTIGGSKEAKDLYSLFDVIIDRLLNTTSKRPE